MKTNIKTSISTPESLLLTLSFLYLFFILFSSLFHFLQVFLILLKPLSFILLHLTSLSFICSPPFLPPPSCLMNTPRKPKLTYSLLYALFLSLWPVYLSKRPQWLYQDQTIVLSRACLSRMWGEEGWNRERGWKGKEKDERDRMK